jgi:hypothetical protein
MRLRTWLAKVLRAWGVMLGPARSSALSARSASVRAAEAEAKLKRLYDAIENGIADVSDPMLKERVTEL